MQQQHSLSQFPRQAHMDVSNLSNEDLPSAYSFSELQLILRLNKCFPMSPVIPSISPIDTLFLILQRYIQREIYILVQLKKVHQFVKAHVILLALPTGARCQNSEPCPWIFKFQIGLWVGGAPTFFLFAALVGFAPGAFWTTEPCVKTIDNQLNGKSWH